MSNPQDDIFRALDMLVGAGTKIVASENAKATALAAQNLSATMKEKEWERGERLLEEKRQYDLSVDETQNLVRDVDYLEKEIYKLELSQEYQDALPKEFKTVEFDNTLNAISQENRENLEGSFAAINENMTSMQINKANAYNNAVKMKELNKLANQYQQGAEMFKDVSDVAGIKGMKDLQDVEAFIKDNREESQKDSTIREFTSSEKKGLRSKGGEVSKSIVNIPDTQRGVTHFVSKETGEAVSIPLSNIEKDTTEDALFTATSISLSPALENHLKSLGDILLNKDISKEEGVHNISQTLGLNFQNVSAPSSRIGYTRDELTQFKGWSELSLKEYLGWLGKKGSDNFVIGGISKNLNDMTASEMFELFYDQTGETKSLDKLKDIQVGKIDAWNMSPWEAMTINQRQVLSHLLGGWGMIDDMLGGKRESISPVSTDEEKVSTKTINENIKKNKSLKNQTVDDPWLDDYSNPDRFKTPKN